jgi:hypothetical protein
MGLPTDLPMPAVAAPSSFVTSASGSRPLLANDPPRSAAPVNLGPMFRFKFLKIPKTFGEKILAVLLKKLLLAKANAKICINGLNVMKDLGRKQKRHTWRRHRIFEIDFVDL